VLLFSLFLFTLLRLYLEIRDIWRPEDGLAGTRDSNSMAQIRDIQGNPGRVATLHCGHIVMVILIILRHTREYTEHCLESDATKIVLYNVQYRL